MKTMMIPQRIKALGLTLALAGFQLAVWAQDGGSSGGSSTTSSSSSSTHSVSVNDGGSNWYNSPWVWLVGAAVFILVLVALLGGGRSRSSSTTTTTTTDTGDRVTTVRRDDVDDV